MVKTPRTRHSKSGREPVTIELGPDAVSRVDAEGTRAPATQPDQPFDVVEDRIAASETPEGPAMRESTSSADADEDAGLRNEAKAAERPFGREPRDPPEPTRSASTAEQPRAAAPAAKPSRGSAPDSRNRGRHRGAGGRRTAAICRSARHAKCRRFLSSRAGSGRGRHRQPEIRDRGSQSRRRAGRRHDRSVQPGRRAVAGTGSGQGGCKLAETGGRSWWRGRQRWHCGAQLQDCRDRKPDRRDRTGHGRRHAGSDRCDQRTDCRRRGPGQVGFGGGFDGRQQAGGAGAESFVAHRARWTRRPTSRRSRWLSPPPPSRPRSNAARPSSPKSRPSLRSRRRRRA